MTIFLRILRRCSVLDVVKVWPMTTRRWSSDLPPFCGATCVSWFIVSMEGIFTNIPIWYRLDSVRNGCRIPRGLCDPSGLCLFDRIHYCSIRRTFRIFELLWKTEKWRERVRIRMERLERVRIRMNPTANRILEIQKTTRIYLTHLKIKVCFAVIVEIDSGPSSTKGNRTLQSNCWKIEFDLNPNRFTPQSEGFL